MFSFIVRRALSVISDRNKTKTLLCENCQITVFQNRRSVQGYNDNDFIFFFLARRREGVGDGGAMLKGPS